MRGPRDCHLHIGFHLRRPQGGAGTPVVDPSAIPVFGRSIGLGGSQGFSLIGTDECVPRSRLRHDASGAVPGSCLQAAECPSYAHRPANPPGGCRASAIRIGLTKEPSNLGKPGPGGHLAAPDAPRHVHQHPADHLVVAEIHHLAHELRPAPPDLAASPLTFRRGGQRQMHRRNPAESRFPSGSAHPVGDHVPTDSRECPLRALQTIKQPNGSGSGHVPVHQGNVGCFPIGRRRDCRTDGNNTEACGRRDLRCPRGPVRQSRQHRSEAAEVVGRRRSAGIEHQWSDLRMRHRNWADAA